MEHTTNVRSVTQGFSTKCVLQEQDIDSDSEWQQLIELSDQGPVNPSILPRLKTKLLLAKKQVTF